VAGEGPERSTLEALAKQLGLEASVVFAGQLEHEEVARLYQQASVMLNPSKVDNAPNSVLESLAAGVPVVSTDAGGVAHLVAHRQTALLVPVGDFHAMAAALISVLSDTALADGLAARGLEFAQRFRWSSIGSDWHALYSSLSPSRTSRV